VITEHHTSCDQICSTHTISVQKDSGMGCCELHANCANRHLTGLKTQGLRCNMSELQQQRVHQHFSGLGRYKSKLWCLCVPHTFFGKECTAMQAQKHYTCVSLAAAEQDKTLLCGTVVPDAINQREAGGFDNQPQQPTTNLHGQQPKHTCPTTQTLTTSLPARATCTDPKQLHPRPTDWQMASANGT
jgi:hypothetical protein